MKKYLTGVFYSLPIQLLLLHFRRYQVLLIFWYLLFAIVGGALLESYGANSLYLAPEYLGNVDALSTSLVGFSIGVFIMTWNISTFIVHTKHIRFLATTAQPFLKYCINNSIIPIAFLCFYFYCAFDYDLNEELITRIDILWMTLGFAGGFAISILISFIYFFSADKSIYRKMGSVMQNANLQYALADKKPVTINNKYDIRIDWFLSARLGLRKPRNVQHYSQELFDSIFKRHHIAAVLAILMAFVLLLTIGFFSDYKTFQIPAAASITVLFAILIAVETAFTLFLGNWVFPMLIVLYVTVNWMYHENIIDPRNKAFGLNYNNESERPYYNKDSIIQLASPANKEADKKVFLQMLENWKQKQATDKPVLFIINSSGGGTRSATFTLNVLQKLDSVTNGRLMPHTFLINGASGGMLGAAYFRELYWQKLQHDSINLQNKQYTNNIAGDLLNPLFSSLISRDLAGPVRTFESGGYTYTRDRAYAFEQKLNVNTDGILNKKLRDYKKAEESATIPIMFFNSTITRDGREMVISTHPARFLMQPIVDSAHNSISDPDLIDYTSFFAKQNPLNLRMLTALRMNATFPYVLPNVWLPTKPVIDVMDAGLRDNFGQETTLRFLDNFKDWLQQNTSKVVLIQIRDRQMGDWEKPYQPNSIISSFTKPFFILQNNWYKMQDYFQTDQLNFMAKTFGPQFYKISFQYVPSNEASSAALSFHLTATEKKDIENALANPFNQQSFNTIAGLVE
jgi:hypothetical protein